MSNIRVSMPLQSKVSLALALLIAAFGVVSYAILRSVIAPAFDDLERNAAAADLQRVEATVRAELETLGAINANWAYWDDMYAYVNGEHPRFQQSSLDRSTLENLDLDLLAIFGPDGAHMWSHVVVDGKAVRSDTFNILDSSNPLAAGITQHARADARTLGFVQTIAGPMMVSSMPVLKNDHSGDVSGAVVVGQFMNAERLARLRDLTAVDAAWKFDAAGRGDVPELSFNYRTVQGSRVLGDIRGKPLVVLQSSTPREISILGSRTLDAAILFLVTAGVLVTGFIFFMIRGTVIRPIERLAAHIDVIRESGDLSTPLQLRRSDEIGVLASQFDEMTAELDDARSAMMDKSFKAGKADTAAEVLHNIRNAMTPMINGLDRLRRAQKAGRKLRIDEAFAALRDPDCGGDRRDKFLQYIETSFERLRQLGESSADDLRLVTEQARQVEGILADQEKFANAERLQEPLAIRDVLQEAANVIPKEAAGDVELEVEDSEVTVTAHRIGLLQVLGNLVLNAYESIRRSEVERGSIRLHAESDWVDDEAMVRVTVDDNGSGFDESTREQLFQRGYTSKVRGESTGLGLHWCANAVASMGGRIDAESRGPGQGARFSLLLPAALETKS